MPELIDRMIALRGPGILKRSALRIRDGHQVFEEILGARRFNTVLEIGTYRGCSAAFMAQFCDKVITVDLKKGKIERNGEAFDRAEFWRALGLDNIELHLIGNDADKARLIKRLDFDFAFIDGAHDRRVRLDFQLVKRCGHVLFHDYSPSRDGGNDVRAFVDTLPRSQIRVLDIFALWTA